MSMELIRNIKALTKIQLKQIKNLYIAVIIGMGFLTLIPNLDFIRPNTDGYLFNNMANGISVLLVIFGFIIAILTNSILSNRQISMYPSTTMSRYISSVLADHIGMIGVVILSFVFYCLEYIILLIMKFFGADILITSAFDIRYAVVGMLYILSYYLMFYGIFVLMNCLFTKIGLIVSVVLFLGLGIVFNLLFRTNIKLSMYIINYFTEERSLWMFVIKTWSIWLIGLLVAAMIAHSIKVMSERETSMKLLIIPTTFFIMIIIAGLSMSGYEETSGVERTSEELIYKEIFNEYKETHLFSINLVKLNTVEEGLDLNYASSRLYELTQNEAREAGIITDDVNLEQDEILAYTFFPKEKIMNNYLYEYYSKNLSLSCNKSSLKYRYPKTQTVLTFFWGDGYKFLDTYKMEESILDTTDTYGTAIVFIITPDENMGISRST